MDLSDFQYISDAYNINEALCQRYASNLSSVSQVISLTSLTLVTSWVGVGPPSSCPGTCCTLPGTCAWQYLFANWCFGGLCQPLSQQPQRQSPSQSLLSECPHLGQAPRLQVQPLQGGHRAIDLDGAMLGQKLGIKFHLHALNYTNAAS